jgi:hypothetical protein
MADNMRLLPDGQFFVSATEPDCAAKGSNEPGKRPKQSRLPGAVGTRKNERFPHPDGERQPVDDPACTAVYDQVFSNELHSDVIP